jgi:hypothetical protein
MPQHLRSNLATTVSRSTATECASAAQLTTRFKFSLHSWEAFASSIAMSDC